MPAYHFTLSEYGTSEFYDISALHLNQMISKFVRIKKQSYAIKRNARCAQRTSKN